MWRICGWLIVVGYLAVVAPAGQAAEARWIRYESRHVTVFSQASDRATRNWVVEFEQIYALLTGLFPRVGNGQPPLTALLFDRPEEFRRFTPMADGKPVEVAGYFMRVSDRGYIALNIADTRSETRALIYHEAVHWFLSASPQLRPAWLEEGMAELFSTARIKQDEFVYGDVVEWHLRVLQSNGALGVERMLLVTHDTPGFNETSRVTPFYATAWLFLHHVVCTPDGGGFTALTKYLGLLTREIPPEDAFRQAFGRDYATMDQELAQYVRKGKYRTFKGQFDRAALDRNLQSRAPTGPEVNLELGYVLALTKRFDQARPVLAELARSMPDNPRVHEALGMLAVQEPDREAAQQHFSRALELGSHNYFCQLGPAMAELAYRESRGGRLGMLSPTAARIVADGLTKTIELEPGREDFYRILALALLNAEPVRETDGKFVEEGIRRFPDNMDIRLGYALYLHKGERTTEALAIYDQIGNSVRRLTPGTRDTAIKNALNLRIESSFMRYQRKLEERDYDGAILALDERMALTPESHDLPRLREHRAGLEDRRDVIAVQKLRETGHADQTRPLLERLVRESSDESVRRHAEMLLREMDSAKGVTD